MTQINNVTISGVGIKKYRINKDGTFDKRYKNRPNTIDGKPFLNKNRCAKHEKNKNPSKGGMGCLAAMFVFSLPFLAMFWENYNKATTLEGFFHSEPLHVVYAEEKEPTIEDKIRTYDWDSDTMIAIAKWESSGWACELDPSAHNTQNSDGSEDFGLFQINSIHGLDEKKLMQVDYNIERAYEIYRAQGLTAWSSYNSGAYLVCMGSEYK